MLQGVAVTLQRLLVMLGSGGHRAAVGHVAGGGRDIAEAIGHVAQGPFAKRMRFVWLLWRCSSRSRRGAAARFGVQIR